MANSSPSRSHRKGDEADVSYEIATPFKNTDATIFLYVQDDDTVEVLIGNIPEPYPYYDNYGTEEREELDQHSIARWIVDDAASVFERWGYETSAHKANSGNRSLRDVYFECERTEVDEAVLAAKRFLTELEEKVFKQRQQSDHLLHSPSDDLFGDQR